MRKHIITSFFVYAVSFILFFPCYVFSQQVRQKQDAEKRLALVIGNSDYKTSPLDNPTNDARDMADTLRQVGFKVIYRENIPHREMIEAVREFGDGLRKGGVGLFYYAGHGMQLSGRNYLIPIGANIYRETDIKYEAMDADRVMDEMYLARNRLNIIILDACRNNPFARSFRSYRSGLAQMTISADPEYASSDMFIAFATAPGSVAADGTGRNGVYTKHLVKHMKEPGLKVEDVFKRVRLGVKNETRGRQVPWESSSVTGDFYFAEKAVQVIQETGGLVIETQPRGATVFVNGKEEGKSTIGLTELKAGMVNVRVVLPDYEPQEKDFNVEAKKMKYLTFLLEKPEPEKPKQVVIPDKPVVSKKQGTEKKPEPVVLERTEPVIPVKKPETVISKITDTVPDNSAPREAAVPETPETMTTDEPQDAEWTDPLTRMEFVYVEGNCYEMGCGDWDDECRDSEKPVHEVCVDDFYISKHEVTNRQFVEFMNDMKIRGELNEEWFQAKDQDTNGRIIRGTDGFSVEPDYENHPAVNVSFFGAGAIAKWMSEKSEHSFRLPTEAEWEYACRSGGQDEKYSGHSDNDQVAWYSGNSRGSTHNVGEKEPNRLGIHDMSGNVWEWCEDKYNDNAYQEHDHDNPVYMGKEIKRVIRGGTFGTESAHTRCARRVGFYPGRQNYSIGFRLIKSLSQ